MQMSQSRKVEDYYNFLSQHYDGATKGKFEWSPPKEAENLVISKVNKHSSVLDVGIGTGQSVEYLASLGCKVCGLDISEKMIEVTRSKFPQFDLFKADLNGDLPMLSGKTFDLVLAIGVLEFVNTFSSVVERLLLLLKEKGYFCFTFEELVVGHELQSERQSHSGTGKIEGVSLEFFHHRHLKSEIDSLLFQNGFNIIEEKRFQAYLKTAAMIPVYYWIVLAQKRHP